MVLLMVVVWEIDLDYSWAVICMMRGKDVSAYHVSKTCGLNGHKRRHSQSLPI